ncbi:MAG: glycosyl hydrolase family 17 protein [Oligoflexales bacterium]
MHLENDMCLGKIPKSGVCPVGSREISDNCLGLPQLSAIDVKQFGLNFSDYGSSTDENPSLPWEEPTHLHWKSETLKPIHWYFGTRMLGFRIEAISPNKQDPIKYSMELGDNNQYCPFWYPNISIDEKTGIISGRAFSFQRGAYGAEFFGACELKVTAKTEDQEISSILSINFKQCVNCKITSKFAVLNYSPYREGQTPLPDAEGNTIQPTLKEIESDMRELKKLTSQIRTYEVDANVLQAAHNYGIGVHLGAYLVAENPDAFDPELILENKKVNQKVIANLIELANDPRFKQTIKSLIIGNEIKLHNYLNEDQMIDYIEYVKKQVNHQFPVTTGLLLGPGTPGQLGPSDRFGEHLDYILYHQYPFWERRSAFDSKETIALGYKYISHRFPTKGIVLGETGWATSGATHLTSATSEELQAIYINDLFNLVNTSSDPQIRALGSRIMYFQAFDEPWKTANNEGGTLAAHWGIYDKDRMPKLYLRTAFSDLW